MSPERSFTHRPSALESRLAQLPPSAKYVYAVLFYEGRLTKQELQAATLLPRRTISNSLGELQHVELVEKYVSSDDARVREYAVTCPQMIDELEAESASD